MNGQRRIRRFVAPRITPVRSKCPFEVRLPPSLKRVRWMAGSTEISRKRDLSGLEKRGRRRRSGEVLEPGIKQRAGAGCERSGERRSAAPPMLLADWRTGIDQDANRAGFRPTSPGVSRSYRLNGAGGRHEVRLDPVVSIGRPMLAHGPYLIAVVGVAAACGRWAERRLRIRNRVEVLASTDCDYVLCGRGSGHKWLAGVVAVGITGRKVDDHRRPAVDSCAGPNQLIIERRFIGIRWIAVVVV